MARTAGRTACGARLRPALGLRGTASRLTAALCGLLASCFFLQAPASAARKALIIGNADYARAVDLRNPANDANDIATRLTELGFEISGGGPGLDLTRTQMAERVGEFAASLEEGDLALFFFAGHGAQLHGENYLIPSDDEAIEFADDLSAHAYAASALMRRLESRPGVTSILILDACRNNPLGLRERVSEGGVTDGLANMDAPTGAESFIIFAAAKGRTASDGEGRNSRFTAAMLTALDDPERRLEDLVYSITAAVRQSSGGAQAPWTASSLQRPVYLVPVSERRREADEESDEEAAAVAEDAAPAPDLVTDGGALSAVTPLVTDFLPDPYRQPVLAGGDIDASTVAPDCRGFVTRSPTAMIDYEAGDYSLYIAASSEADTTLLVLDPSGAWSCSDDVDGLNPYLTFEDPLDGAYRIWVGAYDATAGEVRAELRVSEHGLVVDGGALNPDVTLANGFTPDPMTLDVLAGGSVNARMADAACVGFIARWPDFVVDYDAGRYPLHFSVGSDADTVVVVQSPSGGWFCNDDHREGSTDPAVSFGKPQDGRYRVWIGVFDPEAGNPDAKLYISEGGEPHF